MAITYEKIQSTTLGSAQANVVMSSIPSTYTDLILISVGSFSGTPGIGSIYAQFNSDSATNYSTTILYGDGSSALSTRESSQTAVRVGQMTHSVVTNSIAQIQNYANATTYKTVLSRANISDTRVVAQVGLWRKAPEAINSITITNNTGQNFAAGCTFSLYGIKSA